jgi:hypothetical protein
MDEESTGGMEFRRNHQLKDAEKGRQDQNCWKILQTVTIPGSVVPNYNK